MRSCDEHLDTDINTQDTVAVTLTDVSVALNFAVTSLVTITSESDESDVRRSSAVKRYILVSKQC